MPQSHFVNRITTDETQKTALLFAFYNSVVFILLGLCLVGIFAIYQVFYMFLVPIIWAILVGTVMFPIKRNISKRLKGWLDRLDVEDRPLVIGVALLPLEIVCKLSDYVYNTLLSVTGVYCGIGYIVLKILCFEDVFLRILSWFGALYGILDLSIGIATNNLVLLSVVLYSASFIAWICVQERVHKKFARTLSLPIWIFVLAQIADFFGPLRVLIFASTIVVLSLIALGLIGVVEAPAVAPPVTYDADSRQPSVNATEKPPTTQFADAVTRVVNAEIRHGLVCHLRYKLGESILSTREPSIYAIGVEEARTTSDASAASTVTDPGAICQVAQQIEADIDRLDHALSGDAHLRIISGLCLLLWTVHHDFFLIFIFIPFLIAGFIRVGKHIGVFDVLLHLANVFWTNVRDVVYKVVNIVVAGSLRKFVYLLFSSDKMFIISLSSRVDFIASVTVMASIAIGALFFALFTVFQLHNETVHLVKLGGNLVQSNPDWMKYAINYTEGQLAEHDFDEYIEQAYHQGRKWLASNVRSLADPADPNRADQLEDQVKQLVDSLYRMWTERNSEANLTSTRAVYASSLHSLSPYEWLAQILSTSNLQSIRRELTGIITENIETVITVMQSMWTVILMNISLLRSMIVAVLSVVLGFGFELINLIIELIVFLTAVYYLLSSSGEEWLPLRLIGEFATPAVGGAGNLNIADAFEDAINGVFVLSAKMSIFYGFYTYFVHSLFELNIVFFPSVMAALFASIPIMPPYIVAFVGFVEIFFVRSDTVAGMIFALASIAPLFFADAAFYRELKGTHPYVTGLAVIGGMYWLGLQGAIFGPIILCCVIALFNLYNSFVRSR